MNAISLRYSPMREQRPSASAYTCDRNAGNAMASPGAVSTSVGCVVSKDDDDHSSENMSAQKEAGCQEEARTVERRCRA
mgnify:CR=1 FL=1